MRTFPEHLSHSENTAREQPTAGLLPDMPVEQAYLEMPRMEKQKQGQAEAHNSYLSLLPVPAS